MTDKKKKPLIALLLLAVDVFVTFVFAGMPKDSVSHYVLHANPHDIVRHGTYTYFRVLEDVTLKDINGKDVHFFKGREICCFEKNSGYEVEAGSNVFNKNLFYDEKIFENITEKVNAIEAQKRTLVKIEDERLAREKRFHDLFWYVYPFEGQYQYNICLAFGLVLAGAALLIDLIVFFVFREKAGKFYIISIVVKAALFAWFFRNFKML